MGRLSRHKKIKSCDPFFKGARAVDLSSNNPVQASQLDSQPIPSKAKHLFKVRQEARLTGKKGKSVKDKRKLQGKLDAQRRPGETQREFYQRLDREASDEVNKILTKDRHVSRKRKEFLKARREKANKKRQAAEEEGHKEFSTEKVKFGDVVNEPPNFTSRPRRADLQASTKPKVDSLLLQSKLKDDSHEKEQSKTQILPKSKKRKHMNAFEQQISDKRRLEAIAAYRKMKRKDLEKMGELEKYGE